MLRLCEEDCTCILFTFVLQCISAVQPGGEGGLERGKRCKRRKRPHTVVTRRERNVHIEGRYTESVSDCREQPPDTLGEKHVDIANNTANTQRNLRLTITTSAYDCTVWLEVTRVEATPPKNIQHPNRPPSAMLPLFGLAKLQMPCPWEQPRPI